MPRSAEELAADFRAESLRLFAVASNLNKISMLLDGRIKPTSPKEGK